MTKNNNVIERVATAQSHWHSMVQTMWQNCYTNTTLPNILAVVNVEHAKISITA